MSDMISACRPDPNIAAYIIGGNSYRVSLHTQQLRVLRLIKDLVTGKDTRFMGCQNVAIIGGGAAGVMAAAALAAIGKKSVIFERKRKLMPLQFYSRTRYLHPTAINWPGIDLSPVSVLPFLNWHCNFAEHVAKAIFASFETQFLQGYGKRITLFDSAEVTNINPPGHGETKFEIVYEKIDRISGKSQRIREPNCDCVFFCTGFNEERMISPYFMTSYWEDHNVRPIKSSLHPPKVAIIGDGDGGIIEVMRCFWRSRQFDEIYREIDANFISPEKKQLMANFDEKLKSLDMAVTLKDKKKMAELAEEQSKIYSDCLNSNGAATWLKGQMEFDTSVHLYSMTTHPFSLSASPMHKAILSFLLTSNKTGNAREPKFVKHIRAEVKSVVHDSKNHTFEIINSTGKTYAEDYDRVIGRIGPRPQYNMLIQSVFDKDILKSYDQVANNFMDFSNPKPGSDSELNRFYFDKEPGLKAALLREAEKTLKSYVGNNLKMSVSDVYCKNNMLRVKIKTESLHCIPKIPKSWMGMTVESEEQLSPKKS